MGTKKWGVVLIVVGVLMLVAVLLVSPLHIYGSGFGTRHIMGTIASAVVVIVGIIISLVSPKRKQPAIKTAGESLLFSPIGEAFHRECPS